MIETPLRLFFLLVVSWFTFLPSFSWASGEGVRKERIQLWHQMMYTYRGVLRDAITLFEERNPEIRVEVTYRETEELRSAFQSAAMGGSGPELIYGPSDQVGPFSTMEIIRPLETLLPPDLFKQYDPLSVIQYNGHVYMLGDMVGNNLMLIYNKKLLARPPQDTDELLAMAKAQTIDEDGDGKIDRYGLVWNMSEPYFFVPWIRGFGESFMGEGGVPNLASASTMSAFHLIKSFKDQGVVPKECDYELANALFKEGKAAMIINGDWSWGDYKAAKIDFGVARLPLVKAKGLWPAPLVGPRGYSLNVNIPDEKLPSVIKLLRHLTSPEVELLFTSRVGSLPSSLEARQSPLVRDNDLLRNLASIIEVGEPMPVGPELRAVWDALRPQYQSVLAGTVTPERAAEVSQSESLRQIRDMNEVKTPDWSAWLVKFFSLLIVVGILAKVYWVWPELKTEWRGPNRFAHLMMMPAFVGLFLVVVYPFIFNLMISFSNLSLRTFNSWSIIGFQHYISVLLDPKIYEVLLKTVIWTVVGVFFHVFLGLILALLINQTLPAKGFLRTLLVIPWAVPQYITALTWRGMFNQEYGAINLILAKFLHMSPIQWLSEPLTAFSACILTNIWLGFPFMMIVALGGLQSIPAQLYEAARVDGASTWQRFWQITWPMLQPVMLPAITLGSIWTFNALNVIWLVSNAGEPADKTHILVSYVYKSAFNLYRYGYAAALSVIIFLILLIGSVVFLRWRKATESMY